VSLTDSDLIARVLACDDQHAYGELVRRYQSPVRGFIMRLTRGDTHLADDIAQETFVRAWRKLHTWRGGSRFSTWLFSIAYHEFCKVARKAAPPPCDSSEPPHELEQTGDSPDTSARIDLPAALSQLRPDERAAIVLCCQNGLSHEEAAQVLNCPLGTVKTNVLRGKEKLRKLLYEYRDARTA
jgi:RNA polymerase sigma-70 factor, ECF subfamily